MDTERARRIGENEALFRSVNERAQELGQSLAITTPTLRIVCECGMQSCVEQLELAVAEYERVRAKPTRFLIKPGHEFPDVEQVVERSDGYLVVEKAPGLPERIARESDPRA